MNDRCRVEKNDDMLLKPTEIEFYQTKFGFLQRDEVPSFPLGEQFMWLASAYMTDRYALIRLKVC